jgi:hypothetical protein
VTVGGHPEGVKLQGGPSRAIKICSGKVPTLEIKGAAAMDSRAAVALLISVVFSRQSEKPNGSELCERQ